MELEKKKLEIEAEKKKPEIEAEKKLRSLKQDLEQGLGY